MGTPLTGTSVASSYQSILKIGDNSAISTTIKQLSDGAGHDINVWLSENHIEFRQFLNVAPIAANDPMSLSFRNYSNTGTPGAAVADISVGPIQAGQNRTLYINSSNDTPGGIQISSSTGTPVIQNGYLTHKVGLYASVVQLITFSSSSLPTLGLSERGSMIFDTTTSKFRGWTGTAWVDFH